ncbi:sensor histidine kinase [Streptomyces sp. NPDC059828]|uniref:sensor histidine kinase n=1 Tax=Streptomyces sp. NPDC059828 TaxID=3346965 RepID=UPI0036659433
MVYGGAFLVLGALLLGIVNLLSLAGADEDGATGLERELSDRVRDAVAEQMLIWSSLALLVMAVCAVVVGWWTAGRVLRPVHEMTARARALAAQTPSVQGGGAGWGRIAVRGPDDELKELGDTFDGLLARLEAAFDSQRRFIANASHELRTPLATQRAAIQVGLDESASAGELARTRQLLLDSNRRSERLIEGLLVLARSERGLARGETECLDLGEVVAEECERYGVAVGGEQVVHVRGNRLLLAQLVRNLIANAVAYNAPGGVVDVSVDAGRLTVANTGPRVDAADVPALFEPFRRGSGRDRMGPGAGLGLSIVRSIAVAHGGTVTAEPGPEGGLVVRVSLPSGIAG